MRRLNELIKADKKSKWHFYVQCECCKRVIYANKLPLLCRPFGQNASATVTSAKNGYTRAMGAAAKSISKHFNLCQLCGKWVCDDCFMLMKEADMCIDCARKKSETSSEANNF